jgi:hypothetical protein
MNAFACLRTSTTPPHPNSVQRPSSPFTPLPPVKNRCYPTPQFPNPAAHLSRMLSGFVFIGVNLRFQKNVDSPLPPFPPVQKSPTSHFFSAKTPAIPPFPPNLTSFPRPLPILHFELSTLNFFTSHQNVDSPLPPFPPVHPPQLPISSHQKPPPFQLSHQIPHGCPSKKIILHSAPLVVSGRRGMSLWLSSDSPQPRNVDSFLPPFSLWPPVQKSPSPQGDRAPRFGCLCGADKIPLWCYSLSRRDKGKRGI